MLTLNERAKAMIERYGEAVSKSKAARIIDRSPSTINVMIADGRLDAACGGTRVDVYSIARYICEPAKIDTETRLKKRGNLCRWHVS